MRRTSKFDGAPWSGQTGATKGAEVITGRKNCNVLGKSMRRTGGRRGA